MNHNGRKDGKVPDICVLVIGTTGDEGVKTVKVETRFLLDTSDLRINESSVPLKVLLHYSTREGQRHYMK